MSDRRADDTQPLAPRRTLSAPVPSGTAPVPTGPPVASQSQPQARTTDGPPRGRDIPGVPPPGTGASAAPSLAPAAESPVQPSDRVPAPPRPSVRKARLRIVRVDPWSVMKMAFALSIALAVVTVVAVVIVWLVLNAAGVWDAINESASTLFEGTSFDVTNYVGLSRVLGATMVLAAVDVVLITALATLGAFLYNLAASLLGGFEVTLAEDR